MKLIIGALMCLAVATCGQKKNKTQVLWVSGIKTSCDKGTGIANCFLISKSDNLEEASWELFYSDIEDFNFEEGVLKQIEVGITKNEGLQAADQSAFNYKLIKVLSQQQDTRLQLAGDWQLESMANTDLKSEDSVQTLILNLSDMTVSGRAACNVFSGAIRQLGVERIGFDKLISTLSICEQQAAEDAYLGALRQVVAFKVEDTKLYFFNGAGTPVLTFTKMTKTKNSIRINDIWTAVRIDGYPLNRMVKVPRLEVNTKDLKIYGNDGCNTYFGTITDFTETAIAFTKIGASKMLCPDMEVPDRYKNALLEVKSYSFSKTLLILNDDNGKEVLAFIKGD
jgi:heat shock protein HslJ